MKMADGGFRPAYNVQYATATDGQVVVGVEVTAAGSDMGQISPMGQIHQRFDARPAEALADGGFASLGGTEQAQAAPRGTTAYVPVPKPKGPNRDRHEPLPTGSEPVAQWRQRMKTEQAKEVHKQRASTIECVNAQARNRGLLRLLVRGLLKVKAVALVQSAKKSPVGAKGELSEREFIEAVLYRARTGTPWRDLPGQFGDWNAVHKPKTDAVG